MICHEVTQCLFSAALLLNSKNDLQINFWRQNNFEAGGISPMLMGYGTNLSSMSANFIWYTSADKTIDLISGQNTIKIEFFWKSLFALKVRATCFVDTVDGSTSLGCE
jgi:hypothetical protein